MQTIRLLLADDHHLFRKGLASLLEKEPGFEVVAEAEDGAEAIRKAQAVKPDLVLMDIHMPGVNGLEATRQITSTVPATRVVIVTISEEDKDLFEAIKCGAHGYLSKKVEPEKLRELLVGVFRGEAALSGATAVRILKECAARASKHSETTPVDDLTEREKEVLQLLAAGLTNKEIGSRLDIAENTVKNHLKGILGKLHLQNRVQAAALAIQQGILAVKNPAE
jgi:two-component system, NarL family, nitrate/nitrite response regulator NarL